MSAAFAFIPRKVAKTLKPPPHNQAPISSRTDETVSTVQDKGKGKGRELPVQETTIKPQYSDEDFAILLFLSLSQYRLWSDPDLRRNIEWNSRGPSNDGFFPLSYLLNHPCPLASAHASETVVVKALRAHAADAVDVRMTIPSDDEPGKKRGNFEIRPKFWDDAVYPVSREGWDKTTVYVENIPIKYKTLAGFYKFLIGLLPADSTIAEHNRIQAIWVPPHHSDDPGAEPKLKSFALVTFAKTEDAESLLAAWPWARARTRTEASSVASEAIQFGFRAVSKARWDELNTEYLNYRTRILANIPEADNVDVSALSALQVKPEPEQRALPVEDPVVPTNKTTLRNFFAKGVDVNEAIDYVDFNKGVDSCYLRLTTAVHAKKLVEHFTQNRTIHASGLDDSGSRSDGKGSAKPVDAELVLGKREEVYWEKVPQKVCLQAVQKALGLVGVSVEDDSGSGGRPAAA
ncbi:RRM-3 domain-containing protein [Mycena sanguinolenta]|uniref:RRM-3 domain-containing protein n=1 Tax=Mycena sanguinolenta TaxID=230812 RepID=A0A8H7D6F1_9AGAR|nr:RRM-3 domain-containing protein [Mycena sanguinolenta]